MNNPSMRFDINTRFIVDVKKATKELHKIKGKTRIEILEKEHLDFAIGEMLIFGRCSIHVLKQYNLMTSRELEEFINKFSMKGVFIGIK